MTGLDPPIKVTAVQKQCYETDGANLPVRFPVKSPAYAPDKYIIHLVVKDPEGCGVPISIWYKQFVENPQWKKSLASIGLGDLNLWSSTQERWCYQGAIHAFDGYENSRQQKQKQKQEELEADERLQRMDQERCVKAIEAAEAREPKRELVWVSEPGLAPEDALEIERLHREGKRHPDAIELSMSSSKRGRLE
jgi:hypothetical protein